MSAPFSNLPDEELVRLLRGTPWPDHMGGALCKAAADRIAERSDRAEGFADGFLAGQGQANRMAKL